MKQRLGRNVDELRYDTSFDDLRGGRMKQRLGLVVRVLRYDTPFDDLRGAA